MCFTVQISHNPATANTRSATKNSAIKSATLWSAALEINLCPKCSAQSASSFILDLELSMQVDFSHRFLGMLCVSFLNFFADLTLIQFYFQCLKTSIQKFIPCVRMMDGSGLKLTSNLRPYHGHPQNLVCKFPFLCSRIFVQEPDKDVYLSTAEKSSEL